MNTSKRYIGQQAEWIACRYLESQGLRLVEKNFTCHPGEIDLIMEDKEALVFVEVRFRRQIGFGSGIETIQADKQARLIQTAYYYLQTRGFHDTRDTRFDVVGLDQTDTAIWIKDAFQVQCW